MIHLLNVQPNLPRDIGRFINADTLREFHLESGMKALAPALAQGLFLLAFFGFWRFCIVLGGFLVVQ